MKHQEGIVHTLQAPEEERRWLNLKTKVINLIFSSKWLKFELDNPAILAIALEHVYACAKLVFLLS